MVTRHFRNAFWDIDGVPEVELAFMIDKSHWGEGFATEAAIAIFRMQGKS
jgi:RimJ/RimL family protein N-acetyltransferase